MRKLSSLLALVVGAVSSVATSSPHEVKPDTGFDTGETTRDPDDSRSWADDADVTLAACESVDVGVTAWLSAECLGTPESDAWAAPVGSVGIEWYVRLPGDTSGDTSADTSSTDSGWDDGGGPAFLGDTGADTGGDTPGDTGADTGDTGTDTGDTGRDTGDTGAAVDTGDTGACVASPDSARVHVYVRDAAGEVVFEDIDTVVLGDPMTGAFTADPAFPDCEPEAACTRAWTVAFVVEEGGPVEAAVEGALALSGCSSGNSDAASGAISVE